LIHNYIEALDQMERL